MGWLQNKFEKNFMITTVDYVFNWARKSAVWPMTFGLACCAIEMIASSTARFDIARFEVGDLDGSVLLGRWSIQYLCGAAGRGQDCSHRCLCDWLPAASGEPVLCLAEVAGQDRSDVAGKAPHRSPVGSAH